jgi:hypothetical protein
MIRVNNRDTVAAKFLRMNMKKTIFNDVIRKEIKEAEENFLRRKYNTYNRMPSSFPPYRNNNYGNNSGNNACNSFRSGFN